MIINLSAVNKDGIRMSVAEYDVIKKSLRVSYSKSRLDMETKANNAGRNETTESTEYVIPKDEAPLKQILTIRYFEIPEDAVEVLFIDREFDNRYTCSPEEFKDSYDKESNTYKLNLEGLKRLR